MVKKIIKSSLYSGLALALAIPTAFAAEIDTNTAQMQAMDKITGKVSLINVPVNGKVKFGSFSIVVRACKTRPPEDTPENFAFVDVVDTYNNQNPVNIFRGWMISSSPALNPVEHPIYDVWLLKCINDKVEPSQLLSQDELSALDKIQQKIQESDEAKFKENETSSPINMENNSEENIITPVSNIIPESLEKNPIENEIIETQSISNPPVSESDENVSESFVQEDGAPKQLLNISNDFVPDTESTPLQEDNVSNSQSAETPPSIDIQEIENELKQLQ